MPEIKPRYLNLGCAQYPEEGYVNVDLSLRTPADVVSDLDHRPYPFRSGTFDSIRAAHILEHLKDPLAAMQECHRLLRPGGSLLVKVPHFSRGFTHPEHKRSFDVSFPLFFQPEMRPWYVGTPFRMERMRLSWNAQPYLKRYVASGFTCLVAAVLGKIIDAVANLSPMLSSRLFAFWVGGFEEIEFRFIRVEEPDGKTR